MRTLYLTADRVGEWTGGGSVTAQEFKALQDLDIVCGRLSREEMIFESQQRTFLSQEEIPEPWLWDNLALGRLKRIDQWPQLCHVYAGTFGKSTEWLKSHGSKICYTAAAHDIEISRREHHALGLEYSYPHLTDPELLKRYLAGYLAADVVVCPSKHSEAVMRKLGRTGRIDVIPHGVCLPDESISSLPSRFTLGYLGSYGPDKGVRYLLEAWKKLNYSDATLLLAGHDSTSSWVQHLVNTFGGGNIALLGWQENVSDFYSKISCYVQPSCSEGFGLEVLEALSFGRPVICSDGAGAADCLIGEHNDEDVRHCEIVKACDVDALAESIGWHKRNYEYASLPEVQESIRGRAFEYSWNKVRKRYQNLWKEYLQ